jgi:6-phosphofructokinase 1
VDARMPVERDGVHSLAFPEAGPRAEVRSGNLRVGILVSGGIAPGINAVLSGIVERHEAYSQAFGDPLAGVCEVLGIDGGLPGLCNDGWHPLTSAKMRAEVSKGGSYLTTAREDALLPDNPSYLTEVDRVAEKLHNRDLDILYVVGGEGSMRAAHALWTVYRNKYPKGKLSIVGVPKTMDNDILWVWQSFGFMSAVEKAREIIIQLHTEVRSNPRIAIVQLFGSSSGYVVSHAALGSNVCDLALIPEVSFKMADVCTYLDRVLRRRREAKESPWGLVVMAETAIPEDFSTYFGPQFEKFVGLTQEEKEALNRFQDRKRRLLGQTPDALRSAGLKIVAGAVRYHIDQMNEDNRHRNLWRGLRVLTNEPRHIVRSTPPSVTDVAFGIRLGTMAVDMAMAGYTDCMVSQWLTEFVVVPLKLVVLGRKLVPTDGIFWKTVVSKTGQKEFPGLCGI